MESNFNRGSIFNMWGSLYNDSSRKRSLFNIEKWIQTVEKWPPVILQRWKMKFIMNAWTAYNERLKSSFRKFNFMVDTEILFNNIKPASHECYMTFWPLTSCCDFLTDKISHYFHDLDAEHDLHRITSGFHGAFATGVACQQGTLTPHPTDPTPNTWFRSPF